MANLNFNRVILGGRLTSTPELKITNSGIKVTSFTVAIKRRGKQGEESQTDFIDCVAWRERAEIITQYFHKGSCICVEGTLQKRSYTDKQGEKRFISEIVVDNVYFVDSKSENADNIQTTSQGASYIPDASESYDRQTAPTTTIDEEDDDLPF